MHDTLHIPCNVCPAPQITDLHRHFIDDITIPSSQGKGLLRRVDDVFDCWFESGSMPYGQVFWMSAYWLFKWLG